MLPQRYISSCVDHVTSKIDQYQLDFVFTYTCIDQIFQVAPSLHMVEVRKAKGDTLEFHKVLLLL